MKKKLKKWFKKLEEAFRQSNCMHIKNEMEILEVDIAYLKGHARKARSEDERKNIEKMIEIKERNLKEFKQFFKELNCH